MDIFIYFGKMWKSLKRECGTSDDGMHGGVSVRSDFAFTKGVARWMFDTQPSAIG